MSRRLVVIAFLVISNVAFAQKANVTLVVKKNSGELLQNATAQILKYTDSSILFSKILKQNTAFSLPINETYFVRITAVSFTSIFEKIQIGNNDTICNFTTNLVSKNLDAVVVKSSKPLIKQEDDKTIIDAEPLANTSSNAYEVLEKSPGAILDQDGNVYLNSATPAVIYINGREVRLSAADLTALLKSLPANSISKIEILRTPSAKYDAASSGGIVNIVLKKGIKLGTNGSFESSYYQGVYATQSVGMNINKNDNKLNTYFSYNYNHRENRNVITSDRINQLSNTLFKQDATTKFNTSTHYAGGGFDYKINEKWNLNLDSRLSANNSKNNVLNDVNIFTLNNNNNIGKNISLIQNVDPTFYIGNTLSSKLKIDSLGSEWTNTLEYTYFKLKNTQQYQNVNILPNKLFLIGKIFTF